MIYKPNFLHIFFISLFLLLPNEFVIAEDNGVSVFMYHRVGDNKYPSTNVNTKQLESQLLEVKNNNYNILRASDVIKFINEGIEFKKTLSHLQLMMLTYLFMKMVGHYSEITIYRLHFLYQLILYQLI